MILYRNKPKSKKIPGTSNQNKYVGPIIAHEVNDTYVIIQSGSLIMNPLNMNICLL